MTTAGVTLIEDAARAVAAAEVPDPPSKLKYAGVKVFEVAGPLKEPLLVAFGRVPFETMLRVANAYDEERGPGGESPYDPDVPDAVVDSLNRLHFDRVWYEEDEAAKDGFRIDWACEGITPITVWTL